jgi:hypothetical protein
MKHDDVFRLRRYVQTQRSEKNRDGRRHRRTAPAGGPIDGSRSPRKETGMKRGLVMAFGIVLPMVLIGRAGVEERRGSGLAVQGEFELGSIVGGAIGLCDSRR